MTSKCPQSVPHRSLLRRSMRFASASLLLGGTLLGSGCLDRPVGVSKPVTTNVVVQRQINNAINAIDLLLMIDNSSSMADKQNTLRDAVPQLLGQLVQPGCVDANGNVVGRVALGSGACAAGSSPEFNPVNNIHIGVVTSSLGDHGGNNLCTPGLDTSYKDPSTGQIIKQPEDVNDKGYLAGKLARYSSTSSPTANATFDAAGFLAWGNATKPPMTEGDLTAAEGIFKDMVSATKELGCGLEAQLESWFRFLVDPVPPIFPITKPDGSNAQRLGSDDALLQQRAAFLRPDSLVAIVMLTDENDCSLRDTDVGWVVTNTRSSILTGSTKCAENPNDPCCYSCTNAGPPGGCQDGCPKDANGQSPAAQDDSAYQANIRCWHQKRRFGYEFMYPTSRYVVGLTRQELCPDQTFGDMDCECKFAKSIGASCNPGTRHLPNPLYGNVVGTLNSGESLPSVDNGALPRQDNSLVFLAGIVGVPWQDIGYKDGNGNLVYIPVTDPVWTGEPTATSMTPLTPIPAQGGIWANIYADDNASGAVPADPHMIESIEARPGITAYDNIEHEWDTAYADLEYACIYPLAQSKPCACDATSDTYNACKYLNPNDCCDLTYKVNGRGVTSTTDIAYNKPLCNEHTQVNAKGYPGLRELAVLHDYAVNAGVTGNSIVASICPADVKATSDKSSPGYGYNPAVAALVNRLKEKLKGSCLPRALSVDPDTHRVPCSIVEAVGSNALSGASCEQFCADEYRDPVASSNPMNAAVIDSMRRSKLCDTSSTPKCGEMCLCELRQKEGGELETCQTADEGTVTNLQAGYCYVDPDNGIGNPALVENCPSTQRRILRFVGNNPTSTTGTAVPLPGALVYTACQGSAIVQN